MTITCWNCDSEETVQVQRTKRSALAFRAECAACGCAGPWEESHKRAMIEWFAIFRKIRACQTP